MSDKCVFAVQCGMALILTLLQSLILGVLGVHSSYPRFSSNNTVFQHLALHPDPSVGTVYVGARDHLFQLAGLDGLRLELDERTGPVRDSKDCLPPVTLENCPQAGLVSNHNKLLLVDPYSLQLITCGSVHQGTCQKRSLANVNQVLFSAERPVDTQYVAANDPTASTVGLVVRPQDKDPVLYVGRGYTSGHPPVSTRQLLAEPVFSYEETAKLAVAGRLSEYDHNFFATFARRNHVYFLFYRRDLKAPSREFRTYVARVCLDDQAYYSYVEVPLMCHSGSPRRNYNFLQGAQVGGEESRDSQVLMGVFSTAVSAANGPSEESALCVYSLDEVDHAIDATRDLCYTQYGDKDGNKVAYIEYDVKSNCANLPTNTLNAYPCGSDHTPSPMASREPVVAEAVLDSPSARLTAVAVSVKEGHTIVFLGDSKGNLHKVFLGNSGEVKKYSTLLIQPGLAINSDLLLDSTHRHVYIMTSHSVEKRPVAECDKHTDCTSCLAVKDPYCGWCVLDGRCGMRSDCRLGSVEGHWLWSFDEQQQCLKVESLSRYNASLGEQKLIAVDVLGLPSLSEGDMYSCFFEDTETAASVQGSTVTCATPEAHRLPPVQQGEDSVSVTLSLRFQTVTVAGADFTFYDCSVVQQLSGSMPCSGCVNSRWKCNWCIHQHVCTHRPTCDRGAIIYNQNFTLPTSAPQTIKDFDAYTYTTSTPTTTTLSTTEVAITSEAIVLTTPSVTPPTTPEPTAAPTTPLETTTPLTDAPTTPNHVTTSSMRPSSATTESTDSFTEATTLSQNGSWVEERIQVGLLSTPTPQSYEELVGRSSREEAAEVTLPALRAGEVVTMGPLSEALPSSSTEVVTLSQAEMDIDALIDTGVPVSSASAPSGDGEAGPDSSDFPLAPDTDYQSDSDDLFLLDEESLLMSRGSHACPCVESIQGSSLLPVNVARKITLVGRNLHLYQDKDLDYQCVLVIEGRSVVVDAYVEVDDTQPSLFFITCQLHQYSYSAVVEEYSSMISVRRRDSFQMDYPADLHVRLYNCSVGRSDCSRCHTADREYGCVWCEGSRSSCVFKSSCTGRVQQTCPAPHIHTIEPLSGPVEGGTVLTVSGSNLGQRAEDIQQSVTVAGVPCTVIPDRYEVSSSIVCETTASARELSGHVSVQVKGGGIGQSAQRFRYQDPVLLGVSPLKGPMSGGTSLTITGQNLLTGRASEISILIGGVPCHISPEQYNNEHFECVTGGSNRTGESGVTVRFGRAQRHLQEKMYHYTPDPNVTHAAPSKSFLSGGRIIRVSGQHLDVVQEPRILVTLTPLEKKKKRRRRSADPLRRERRIVPEPNCPEDSLCVVKQVEFTQVEERCTVNSSSLILCLTPEVGAEALHASVSVRFLLDNLHFEFEAVSGSPFIYEPNPVLHTLNQNDPSKPFRHKPGSIISVEGENLDLAMSKEEVAALIGDGECAVKTLTRNHLYCEPPTQQPTVAASKKREAAETLPDFTVRMGNLNFSLGRVQYDSQGPAAFPLEAQVGVGVGASIVALIVLVIVLIYRRKSKQALRDYKKVQIQLENLETSVRDRCKKEFTDLMTEMMDVSSDLMGSGIPFLDYRKYSERIFFPGHRDSPLRRDLDVPACRRATVEQGLVQLSNLLNSKLFLTKFIHTLEAQRTFSPRDRAYVASLLTVALHGKLEYFTDILKTLLSHLVEQYTTKNPKLMLRRTESVVEKLLTNWMSICLYTFLRDTAGEAFYMLFRAIKHQVDKGPVDAVSGKAKYTLNDNRLLREDVEYRTLTLNVLVTNGGAGEPQTVPTKVLDCDTITQVKEKIVEQTCKGMSYTQRPSADSVHLEWRAGTAGHLILSDQDLTSVVQGSWKRLNTLQHYKVPDGATVTLVSRQSKQIHHDSQDYIPGEKTPMLDDGDEGGVKQWHLVKANEEAELPKHRRGSLRDKERERAKAIPEIYLTRLLSVKGTLQKFVDDLFTVILSTSQPVPMAVKYFFDLLDDQATQHNITDPETIHIWKTNSLPLRFWINILKNPQFIFDVQASDNVDAVLSVIAQTFMDSCTIADHKLGRDSPINKLLYARDIPRYKQMVERYYSDIRQTIPVSDQEMNSSLAELSRNYSNEVNHLVALHELYKYINKYYDQIITALEEDSTAQKMQLGYRLQQIAAAVENKVTDL
ncbi:plexin-B1 isoform X1 [Rhinichthys klamathensis goyatoka]|uniref:plexin-B1 isoform X1 n=1 Tax=Rhinichthys klamathensis goyatoka TaxID=3034132 RepID=UPI0024B48E69|nr:plexin-B1 isoform X1 [Rhinichthys klamathensis goyatoka]XP_056106009.1 plexin-B1 isoform X1 [Rhinichthys klamathensis goyatoka]